MLASAVITHNRESPPARILRAWLEGRFRGLLSPPLVHEYRRILGDKHLQHRHGWSALEIDDFVDGLFAVSDFAPLPARMAAAPDSDDQHLWDLLLIAERATVLVTGDIRLIDAHPTGCVVVSAGFFAQHYLR